MLTLKKIQIPLLISFVIFFSLLSVHIVLQSAIFSHLLFISFSFLFSIIVLVKSYFNKVTNKSFNVISVIFLIFLVLFYYIKGYATSSSSQLYNLLMLIALIFLLFSASLYVSQFGSFISDFAKLITFVALFQSIYCILQYFNILGSSNVFIRITGTFPNPNVTGIFLAMSLPFLVFLFKYKQYRIYILAIVILSLVAIVMLQTRTAIVACLIFLLIEFVSYLVDFKNALWSKYKYIILITTLLLFFLGVVFLIFYIKSGSTLGRFFILSNCIEIIKSNYNGYGLGMFEATYSKFQANYFINNSQLTNQSVAASFITTPYNEILKHLIEGGIFGSSLFVLFIVSILYRLYSVLKANDFSKNELILFCQVILGFIVMICINYTFSMISSLLIFVIIVAHTMSNYSISTSKNFLTKFGSFTFNKGYLKILSIMLCIFFIYHSFSYIISIKQFDKSIKMASENNYDEAYSINKSIAKSLFDNPAFLYHHAKLLVTNKKYKSALFGFNKATFLGGRVEYYTALGFTFQKLRKFKDAENALIIASNIQPSKFLPKIQLLNFYFETKDTLRVIDITNQIAAMPMKVVSKEVIGFKNYADSLSQLFNKYQIRK
jgi:O-antigen polymerase